tara:strand:+ start:4834 stop:5025 length:192 start_codon:yes stop_codon:yes gene_type:complete
MIAWLAEFIGRILKHILPALFDEARKPKKTKMAGGDNELQKDIDNDIAGSIGDYINRVSDKDS